MTWKQVYKPSNIVMMTLLFQGCVFYSFSGTSLSREIKTFSIQNFQVQAALAPVYLAQQLTEKLCNSLLQNTSLNQVDSNGDIQFEGVITSFKYEPIAISRHTQGDAASRMQLTITAEVSYTNTQDKELSFSKKSFAQSVDMDATANFMVEEPNLVEAILQKLVKDIANASIDNW